MASQTIKDQPTSRVEEPTPASEELDEADLAFRHAIRKVRAQIEDKIAVAATEFGKSYKQVARHFFLDIEDKWDDDYSLLPDEEKQDLFEWLQEDLDARGTTVSNKQTSRENNDERGILAQTHDVRMALNGALNKELIEFNATSEIQYFLAARSKAKSIVNAEPSVHFTSAGGEESTSQRSYLNPSELAASFEAFSLNETGIYDHAFVSDIYENPVMNMIQAMLHDQLYALIGIESPRLECSRWDGNMTGAQGIVIECEFAA